MSLYDPYIVDRMFLYPERKEVVLGLEVRETYVIKDVAEFEVRLRQRFDFYVAFVRAGKIEHYHPEAAGFTPWIELAYHGTLEGDWLAVVHRACADTVAKGIDVRLLAIERT